MIAISETNSDTFILSGIANGWKLKHIAIFANIFI
jgi:hypothetical protein